LFCRGRAGHTPRACSSGSRKSDVPSNGSGPPSARCRYSARTTFPPVSCREVPLSQILSGCSVVRQPLRRALQAAAHPPAPLRYSALAVLSCAKKVSFPLTPRGCWKEGAWLDSQRQLLTMSTANSGGRPSCLLAVTEGLARRGGGFWKRDRRLSSFFCLLGAMGKHAGTVWARKSLTTARNPRHHSSLDSAERIEASSAPKTATHKLVPAKPAEATAASERRQRRSRAGLGVGHWEPGRGCHHHGPGPGPSSRSAINPAVPSGHTQPVPPRSPQPRWAVLPFLSLGTLPVLPFSASRSLSTAAEPAQRVLLLFCSLDVT